MVSFIVIGRNEGWRLEKCFNGIYSFVKAEDIKDYEVVYVDSKSSDNSVELSKRVGNTKTILITGECNAAIARNIGAKEATGDILFFIDGDMELIPGFWSNVVHNGNMLYPFMSGIEEDILYDSEWNYIGNQIRRKYIEGKDSYEVTTGGLFVIDSSLWEKAEGMDNRFKRSQDLDLGFRLTKMGIRLCRKSQLWVKHYTRDYVMRSDNSSFLRYTAMLSRKHFFNIYAQKFLLGLNYPVWILLISIFLFVITGTGIPFLFYFIAILYRTYKSFKKNRHKSNLLCTFIQLICNDFRFLYYLFIPYPSKILFEYEIK